MSGGDEISCLSVIAFSGTQNGRGETLFEAFWFFLNLLKEDFFQIQMIRNF
jgi:hypothetical protein